MDKITEIRRPVEEQFQQFERLYNERLSSENPLLNDVLLYIGSTRGKQLRPLLTLLAAKLTREITEKTLLSAVALEMLHAASLVHDDVVDASAMRRGKESVQQHWSNKVAVLSGDYMLARVIGITAEIRNTHILDIVAELGQNLSSGEILQLHAGGSMWIEEEQYYRVIEQKTARLFMACMEAGGESAGISWRQRTALREFGLRFGLCFQIKDDILDYGEAEDIGKPTMEDLRDGKVTLPLIESLRRAPQDEAAHIRDLGNALASGDPHMDRVRAEEEIKSFVLRYRGIDYAYQQMLAHKKKATEALRCFRDCPVKDSLLALLDYAINRIH